MSSSTDDKYLVRPRQVDRISENLEATQWTLSAIADAVRDVHVTAGQCGNSVAAAAINEFVSSCVSGLSVRGARVTSLASAVRLYVSAVTENDGAVAADYAKVGQSLSFGRSAHLTK